jgi:hypothetical protein
VDGKRPPESNERRSGMSLPNMPTNGVRMDDPRGPHTLSKQLWEDAKRELIHLLLTAHSGQVQELAREFAEELQITLHFIPEMTDEY